MLFTRCGGGTGLGKGRDGCECNEEGRVGRKEGEVEGSESVACG